MKWNKLGLIFSPSGNVPWMRTHAALPVPLHLEGDVYRVYYASRDEYNRSHVGFIELDVNSPDRILHVCAEAVLGPGPLGCFDDHGAYASSVVRCEGELYMYYIGWNPGARKPLFYSSVGLAISKDGGKHFEKISRAPIMSRSEHDPCLVTSPFVLRDEDLWRMWYVSGYKWEEQDGSLESYYDIKYADSGNGLQWSREGLVCIGLREGEKNIARPWIVKEGDVYKMWYSCNTGEGYRIGYATSTDGLSWTTHGTPAGLDLSSSGWDSEAMAYPSVVKHEGRWLMFYNGNNFGRDGIGLAMSPVDGG